MDKGELPSSVHFGLWSQLLLSNCGTPDAWWRMSSLFPPGRKQMPFIFCRWNIEFKKRRHGAIRRLTRRGQVGRELVASQCKWRKQQLQERKRGQNVTQNRANGNGHLPEKFCHLFVQKNKSQHLMILQFVCICKRCHDKPKAENMPGKVMTSNFAIYSCLCAASNFQFVE